jgi:two-component system sensor histidine kinase KdpD
MERDSRPEPEALLAEAKKEGRGRLKIFLGAAPGVGKTYAMLEAAQRRRAEGLDVVVGVVETHGRAETERLVAGLELLPRAQIVYGGRPLAEMDLDALLKRSPRLALVDELAHTNVPGSRHAKRWQDVEELLDAGIDVYSTLNIQHLESLNDVVARIVRVKVRETVPDKVLEIADEIELIDLPPEELIERLRQGKVYVPEQIARAIQNFFSKGNLTALRELAMRVAADRVDAQMAAHMRSHAIPGPWPAQDRVLVCVNEAPVSKALVRAAKRMAERSRTDWIAASVVTPQSEQLPEAAKDTIAETLRLAETLGADITTINAGSNVADEILAYARSRNVSRIVIGRPRPRLFTAWFSRETVAEEIIRKAQDFEVTIVSADPTEARKAAIRGAVLIPERDPKAYLWSFLAVVVATVVAIFVNRLFPVESLSLFFLVAVLGVAARFGLWPSIFASTLAFLSYNFFLTEPFFTFEVANQDLVLTLFLFLLVAIVTGNLAARLRDQARAQRAIAKRTANLFDFSRKVASVASLDDVVWAAVTHVASTMQCSAMILMPDGSGKLSIMGGMPPEDQLEPRDRGAAEWAWDKREPAGWSSRTLPSATWLFLPMKSGERVHGLLGVQFGTREYITTEERRLLDSLVDQVGLAIERTKLAADMEQSRLLAETESLRAALLSSVSHDLRTPLVSIIGAATSLVEADEALGRGGRQAMAETIRDEGERLNRYVQNLLDMTRLGYGALKITRQPVDMREVIGRALRRLERDLAGFDVVRDLPVDLPDISGDAVLLEQVVTNILDNAAKYAPEGSRVIVSGSEKNGVLELAIADQGPGIPEADRKQVFDMFFRVRAGDGQPGGTGLGLAIARGIVDAHGGSIRAEDAMPDGSGTRIVLALPTIADTSEQPESAPPR